MRRGILLLTLVTAMVLAFSGVVLAQQQERNTTAEDTPSFRGQNGERSHPNRLIVKLNADATSEDLEEINRRNGARTEKQLAPDLVPGLYRVGLPADLTVRQAVGRYRDSGKVQYAEPDFLRFPTEITTTSDPYYKDSSLWGLYNTGLDKAGITNGTRDADVDASEAWDLTKGARNAQNPIAVIDTGVDINHPDLKGNIWKNPGEAAGDGIDNDRNGKVDDVNGWDFYRDDKTVYDSANNDSHGTHVAGTIGALGNNTQGVVGVNWEATIMPLKFMGPAGGYTSDAVDALGYAVSKGAIASNNSWGGGGYSQALYDTIKLARDNEHIFVVAASNGGSDSIGDNNDMAPIYPASYGADDANTSSIYRTAARPNGFAPLDNVIAVASTTRYDKKSSFSNYGAKSVDLGAPGSSIYSTLPNNKYGSYSGTSMATPHVTGAVALLRAYSPSLTGVATVKDRVLATGDCNSELAGKTTTGRRLNVNNALLDRRPAC